MRKRVAVASTIVLLGAVVLLLTEGRDRLFQHLEDTLGLPAYHYGPPPSPLPPVLDPENFRDNPTAQVAYYLASQIPETLYQVPCACPCHKIEHHQSLYDCFYTRHGEYCSACKMEAIYCFEAHKRGMSPEAIRNEIAQRRWVTVEMDEYARTHPLPSAPTVR